MLKIGIGPKTSTGGAVIEGNNRLIFDGLAARAGNYVACGCPPGSNTLLGEGTITLGSNSVRA